MDFGGVKLAPAAASPAFANRVEPTQGGAKAVATVLPSQDAVRAVKDSPAVVVDVKRDRFAEQQLRELALREFIQRRNVVDPRSRELVSRSVDTRTGEIIRQYPDEVTLKLRDYLSQLRDSEERQSESESRISRIA